MKSVCTTVKIQSLGHQGAHSVHLHLIHGQSTEEMQDGGENSHNVAIAGQTIDSLVEPIDKTSISHDITTIINNTHYQHLHYNNDMLSTHV